MRTFKALFTAKTAMSAFELFILAVGLSMDAFAVSICAGIASARENRLRVGVTCGLWFGGFQALMPLIGYYAAHNFYSYIQGYDYWVAFALLAYLGISMIREAKEECAVVRDYGAKKMFLLAVATSIDALAVGVSLAFLKVTIIPAVLAIGTVTFGFSFVGCLCGQYIGMYGKEKAEMVGGAVLIFLGVKILLEHVL